MVTMFQMKAKIAAAVVATAVGMMATAVEPLAAQDKEAAKAVGKVPSWEDFERYFQRPWIDHMSTWLIEVTAPSENLPHYGREYARLVSMAGLMLQLDLPRKKKEKLLIGFVQLGIDLSGLCQSGMTWNLGGGHTSGRKWPIVFAGLMLGFPPETTSVM